MDILNIIYNKYIVFIIVEYYKDEGEQETEDIGIWLSARDEQFGEGVWRKGLHKDL